jgi:hypothetical protein
MPEKQAQSGPKQNFWKLARAVNERIWECVEAVAHILKTPLIVAEVMLLVWHQPAAPTTKIIQERPPAVIMLA